MRSSQIRTFKFGRKPARKETAMPRTEIVCEFIIADKERFKAARLSENWNAAAHAAYQFGDFFQGNAWERARAAKTNAAALAILEEAYKGCDVDGIGLRIKYLNNSDTGDYMPLDLDLRKLT